MGIGGEIEFLGRRGMSPLIATVLLMAFAVALGGMIMNIKSSPENGDCSHIKVDVSKLCASNNQIFLSLRNSPESIALHSVKLRVTEGNVENILSIKDSKLAPGQPFDVQAPALTTASTNVEIIGELGDQNPVTCNTPLAIASPIPSCPA